MGSPNVKFLPDFLEAFMQCAGIERERVNYRKRFQVQRSSQSIMFVTQSHEVTHHWISTENFEQPELPSWKYAPHWVPNELRWEASAFLYVQIYLFMNVFITPSIERQLNNIAEIFKQHQGAKKI